MISEGHFDGAEDCGVDASDVAEVFEDHWVSGSVASEVEVVSFDDDAGLVVFDHLIQEGFGVFGEEFWGWGQGDNLVGSGVEQAGFAEMEGFDLRGGHLGVECGHGVGIKAQDDDAAGASDAFSGLFDEHLVPEVDAVVVADGQGGLVGHGG